jgi:hypothetical protein
MDNINMASGIPSPASLTSIVSQLFQNENYQNDNLEEIISFSQVHLSPIQLTQLVYPTAVQPLNFYMLDQVDRYKDGEYKDSFLSLISFVQKSETKHIYAYYYDINNQSRFSVSNLVNSMSSIQLADTATFSDSNYIELFNNIDGRAVILGHSSNPSYSSLQYSKGKKYYYETLTINGIIDPSLKIAELNGLSENLSRYGKE